MTIRGILSIDLIFSHIEVIYIPVSLQEDEDIAPIVALAAVYHYTIWLLAPWLLLACVLQTFVLPVKSQKNK